MSRFVGNYMHTLDAKSRLILPAKFRSGFQLGGYLSPDAMTSLALRDEASFDLKCAELERASDTHGSEARRASQFFHAMTFQVEVDRQGRFVVPKNLLEHANLTDEVMVVGYGNAVTFWNPATFAAEIQAPAEQTMAKDLL